jgi:hypothetical protein
VTVGRGYAAAILAACFLALSGCVQRGPVAPEEAWLNGYTCCNLHYEAGSDWISDGNYTGYAIIPAGSRIRVAQPAYDAYRVRADINGVPFRLGQDYGRRTETFADWVGKLVVSEDPWLKISTWPPEIQEAVRIGKIALGMTREQVITSIGYPLRTATPSLNYPVWRYWQSSFVQFDVHWADGRVARVTRVGSGRQPIDILVPGSVFR